MQTTAADYNVIDRAIEMKLDIYFNGSSNEPLECNRSNYLVDASVLDEACSDTETFIGAPSANEISFTLLGENGLFNPAKIDGPYYGKIKAGIMVCAYIRPIDLQGVNEYDWDSFGIYFVTDWQTDITGVTADVTANDQLYSLFNSSITKLKVLTNCTYQDLLEAFLAYNGYSATIDGDLTEELDYGYIVEENAKFLSNFSVGALVYIYCDHTGGIKVLDIDKRREIDHILTDSDQIISIRTNQSALLEYDGVELTYSRQQVSDELELMSSKQQSIAANGEVAFMHQGLSSVPCYAINRVDFDFDHTCHVSDLEANALEVSYVVHNDTSTVATFSYTLHGYIIDNIPVIMSDDGESLLKVDNKYVQNASYAERLKALLNKYVSLRIPKLELEVRGNPKYNIGDKVHVHSEMYDTDFTGIIIRQDFKYDGGLSASLTLLSSDIVGG